MSLLIHDLSPKKWEEVKTNYPNCTVISDNNSIQPCSGCFSCWTKTPGKCVIKDIYAEPYLFPRSLYIWIANHSWKISKTPEET